MKLVDLDSDLWEVFCGAYGNVSEELKILMGEVDKIPPQKKLRRLETEEKDDYEIAFDNICENLWHQMSFYPATYLVLPYFVTLLEQKEKEQNSKWEISILSQIGLCLATCIPSNHIGSVEQEIMDSFQESVSIAAEKVKVFLFERTEELKKLDKNDLSMFCTAALAILGDREAAFVLTMSAWDTCYMVCAECDYCDEDISLSYGGKENIIPAESVIGKWDKVSYEDTYLWLSNVCHLLGDDKSAELLSYFYGTYTCPECENTGIVMDFMKNYCFG